MATSIPETYRIADLIQWHREKSLVINEEFQRRSVWTSSAKSYLIDTVLRQLPIPTIYMRTSVDPRTQKAYREVVDGQQRLRTFVEFSSNRLKLDKRSKEFAGLSYEDLDTEFQERFLAYPVTVVQLINANVSDVLEIFSRLNSYNVAVNAAELRHAKFQGEFKWAVHEAALRWDVLWEKYHIVSVRQRVRMQDDSLVAEMFGVLLQGVTDGGERKVYQLYEKYDEKEPWDQKRTLAALDSVLGFADQKLESALVGNLARSPHFLMLFASLAHALVGIPSGEIKDNMPERDPGALSDIETALLNLEKLDNIIGMDDEPPRGFREFWLASSGTTHRISSRRARFPTYYRALLPYHL
ncbi:MAG TPA: DUF262 domain-containing protein [Dehalococcoidia bacterium]|nr:DUF262 domain-containing protein [Dehalococcoidia bacterium]